MNILLYQLSAFTIHGEIWKKSYKNNKFKVSAPTWNEEFELSDGPYSVSDVQDYVEYISKSIRDKTVNPSIRICANKIENRVTFKIKAGYYLFLKQWNYLVALLR